MSPSQADVRHAYRCDREQVKHLRTMLPCIRIAILLLTLVVETIDLGNLPGFVVAAKEGDLVRVTRLQCQQIRERLQTVVSSVNEISLHIFVQKIRGGVREGGKRSERRAMAAERMGMGESFTPFHLVHAP